MPTEIVDVNTETSEVSNIPEKYRNRTVINSKYIFEKKIGSGSFGTVYRGKNIISGDGVAIKFEATTANIPTLLWESKVMNHLAGKPGVVKLRYFGTESNKNIIVMDLFSHTLCEEITKIKTDTANMITSTSTSMEQKSAARESSKESASSPTESDFAVEIKQNEQNEHKEQTVKYSSSNNSNDEANTDIREGTVSTNLIQPKNASSASSVSSETPLQLPSVPVHIIAVTKYLISMIEIIARVHEAGIVHRDIKPDNFMLSTVEVGNTVDTANKANSIEKKLNIIDFGLSRFYMKGDKHLDNTNDKSIVGTIRYISKHIHEGNVYSRRDDIISILYVAIYLAKGSLPWMGVTAKKGDTKTKEDMVYDIKTKTSSTDLCEGVPYLFKKLLDYSYSLDFEDKPDYSYMTRQCKNYLKTYV
jgi:hypothetical protein